MPGDPPAQADSSSSSPDGGSDGADGSIGVPTRTFKPVNTTTGRNATKSKLPKAVPEEFTPFIKINNGQFDHLCRPYYPTGFNAYELTFTPPKVVDQVFDEAAAKGMSTARTWAHSISEQYPFQIAPGKYDPAGLEGLDYVLASAAAHNMTMILSFIDNWKYYNGVDQFIDWSETAPARTQPYPRDESGDTDTSLWTDEQKKYEVVRHRLFFTDPGTKQLYKDHVKFILNRKNSVNGRIYKEDPTVLSWNLINEPRCETWIAANEGCHEDMDNWYQEMAEFVRTEDPNHLVSSGSEGFWGPSDPSRVSQNPQDWAVQTGQDFLKNNKHMDFAVTHAWPDNWEIPNAQQGEFLGKWLDTHLDGAKTIGKPLLFEEFGKKLEDPENAGDIQELRDPVYQATYRSIEKAVQSGEPLLGSMYWKWDTPTIEKGPYGVSATDSTMKIINSHAKKMHDLINAVPPRPGCIESDITGTLGAWFPAVDKKSGERGCVNNPEVSLAYYTLYGPTEFTPEQMESFGFTNLAFAYAKALRRNQVKVFPTREECCAPGFLGAFPEGCSK